MSPRLGTTAPPDVAKSPCTAATGDTQGWLYYDRRYLVSHFLVPSERVEHDNLVALVERILKAKRADAAADTTALDREIDERAYRLYGLTANGIKITEEERR